MSNNVVSLEKIRKETFTVSPDELIGSVVRKEDFAIINGKIEPTRDLMLKLSSIARVSKLDTHLAQVVSKGTNTVYIFKASIVLNGKEFTGHGACDTSEISGKHSSRLEHDAMATAETRAIKRAFEAAVGLPFINEIILKLFGGYETPSGEKKETPQITSEEFIQKIREAKALPHLRNIWVKYAANLKLYSPEERLAVETAKNIRKEELKNA
ncbi:MAG: hypothetical protein QW561_04335 [Candidatus Aenigmatarchaeota archaeon]